MKHQALFSFKNKSKKEKKIINKSVVCCNFAQLVLRSTLHKTDLQIFSVNKQIPLVQGRYRRSCEDNE